MADTPFPKHLGRYHIVRELGRGAMGVVYEGQDPHIGRRVAIKTARRELITGPDASPDLLERFFREARVAGMLNHPNIITVYDAGEQDGTAFIAMEYIDGVDLGTRIAQGPRFSVQEAVELIATLAEALAFAHDQGIIHRDVKPANIMLPKSGPPRLADFGIARVLDSTLTQEGSPLGTPSYMSPEQFTGQSLDGRSDLFSLAIILYELLAAERPFTGAALPTVMHHILKTDPVPLHQLNFSLGESLSGAVMRALAKALQDRYPDGRAFAAALRTAVLMGTSSVCAVASEDDTVRMNPRGFFADGAALPLPVRSGDDGPGPNPAPTFSEGVSPNPGLVSLDEPDLLTDAARRHQGSRLRGFDRMLWVVLAFAVGALLYFNHHAAQQPSPATTIPPAPSVAQSAPPSAPSVAAVAVPPSAPVKRHMQESSPHPAEHTSTPAANPSAVAAKDAPTPSVPPPTAPNPPAAVAEAQPLPADAPPAPAVASSPTASTVAPAPSEPPATADKAPVPAETVPKVVLETPSDPAEHPKLKVTVYATADDRAYLEYQQLLNSQANTDAFVLDALTAGRIEPLRGAGYSVVVYDPGKMSEPFATESLTEDGNTLIPLPDNTPKIKFEVHSGKDVLLPIELAATACQNAQTFVVLCPNCIPNRDNPPSAPTQ